MYRVLIVDDEKMIREGIRIGMDWKALGIEPEDVYTAASGKEALELAKTKMPQILITDISMAEMTGLELVKELKAICKEKVYVIVLTGYDSFDYARQALRLQVDEFLLKPVDEDLLADVIKNQIRKIEEIHCKHEQEVRKYRARGIVDQKRLEDIFQRVIQGKVSSEEITVLNEEFYYPVDKEMIAVVIVPRLYAASQSDYQMIMRQQILALAVSMIDSKELGISIWNGNQLVIALFSDKCGYDGVDVVEKLSDMIRNEYEEEIRSAIGNAVPNFKEFYRSFREAVYLLENETGQMREVLITQKIQSKSHLFRDVYEQLLKEMEENIANTEYMLRIFDALCMAGQSYNLSDSYMKRCCFEVASRIFFINSENGRGKSEQTLEQLMETMGKCNRDQICNLTRAYLEKMTDKEEEHEMIGNAKRYIKQNLNQNLSVAIIAEHMYVSANYFSRLFKKITGERCNEYIVKKRMEKAKILIETTSFNTGAIAEMVGYSDSNYFSISFKKYFGVSPTHYRAKKETNKDI